MTKSRKNTSHYQYKRFWRKKWFWVFLGTLIFLCLLLCWYARITPLPKDEEMIAHLQEHRAEFEEIIRRHRLFIYKEYDPAIRFPAYEEGMQELWKQAGIHGVSVMLLGLWLPDPYSLKTAQRVKEIEKSCADDWKQYHALEGKKCNLPPPQCRLLDYQYGGLRIKIEPYSKYFGYSLRYRTVWKDFIHFPEPPKIENGYLFGAPYHNGQPIYKKRVLSSLNYYPWHWKEYKCVYRRIDAHWFLRLCNGH